MDNGARLGGRIIRCSFHGANEMNKHKIAAALVCGVFFMGLPGGVAGAQERPYPGSSNWEQALEEWWEWARIVQPPPGFSPIPEGLTPWDSIPCVDPGYPDAGYNNLSSQPFHTGLGVPQPGTIARWGGVTGAQERPDTAHTYLPAYGVWYPWLDYGRDWSWWDPTMNSYEWWLGGAPPPFPFPEGLTPRDNIPAFSPNDPYSGYGNLGTQPFNSGVAVPEPGTLVLLIGGGLCLLGWGWRRRRGR